MKRSILKGLVLFLICLSANAEIKDYRLPLPLVETLPNGLKVAWFLDDRLPLVDLGMLIGSGTRHDPRGKSGTVELLARLLERGANGFSPQSMAEKIESLGATGFASSDEESITLGIHGLAQDADELLQYLSWIALRPTLSPVEFKKEKEKVQESWKHLPDSAEGLAGFVFGRAILGGTPYGRGSLQDLKEYAKLSLPDLRSFHKSHFTPKNALLLVVGRVDQASFREKITQAFGEWEGGVPRKTSVVYRDPRTAINLKKKMKIEDREILLVDRPGLPQAQIRVGFRVPGIRSEKRYPLSVANALLGEYFNSRLNLIVRDKLGLAYGIQSSLVYYKDLAFFVISSATAASTSGQLLVETVRQLRLMKAADVLTEEIEVAKDFLLGGYPLSVSTLGAVASRWMNGYAYGFGPDYLNEFMPNISAVTRESVVQALDEAFQLDEMLIVVAGDAKRIEKSLIEKGFKRVRKVPASSLL